jgi:hypothetical protein
MELPPFAPRADVLQFATAFGMVDAEENANDLCAMSRRSGRIRVYLEVLQKAKLLASAKGQEFRFAHIPKSALPKKAEVAK